MKEKPCIKCKEIISIDQFYRHSKMLDGHLNKCKKCCKTDTKENRIKNIDYYTKYEKERNQLPHRVEARIKYQKENKEKVNECKRAYNKRNPHKKNARLKVKRAIQKGILIRAKHCQKCGEKKYTEAHHNDYEKPLEVDWLCKPCHTEEHWG